MEGYLSIRETALKWGVSQRRVNQYCSEGRVLGAVKFGASWAIPQNAQKPTDPRREKNRLSHPQKARELFQNFMPLLNTAFVPGKCLETVAGMREGDRKGIATAEYHYFTGQAERAMQEAEKYLESENEGIRFSASWLFVYSCLSVGRIEHARDVLQRIQNALVQSNEDEVTVRSIKAFVAFGAAVLLHLPLPDEMPPTEKFLPLLPPGLRAFALYVQAHYLYLKGEYAHSAGIVEATLDMGASSYPISAIYLHLVAVMDYMGLRQTERAEEHLFQAWEIAKPDDLIESFGEHHGLLGGMLEAVIKPNYPYDFKRIIDITYRFSSGWRRVHNPLTGHDVADDLTTTEFAISMLAARGWKNAEIAKYLNVSVNTVKTHISEAMKKLCVESRKELKQYMLR